MREVIETEPPIASSECPADALRAIGSLSKWKDIALLFVGAASGSTYVDICKCTNEPCSLKSLQDWEPTIVGDSGHVHQTNAERRQTGWWWVCQGDRVRRERRDGVRQRRRLWQLAAVPEQQQHQTSPPPPSPTNHFSLLPALSVTTYSELHYTLHPIKGCAPGGHSVHSPGVGWSNTLH